MTTNNPFSPNYQSQIKPFRKIPFKLPTLDQPPSKDSIAPANQVSDKDRKAKLVRASI